MTDYCSEFIRAIGYKSLPRTIFAKLGDMSGAELVGSPSFMSRSENLPDIVRVSSSENLEKIGLFAVLRNEILSNDV